MHDFSIRTTAASLARCIIFFTIGSLANAHRDYTRKILRVRTACEILRSAADLNGENIFWAEAECGLAIISSCLPTLGRLLHRWTVGLNIRAWMGSFLFRNAAGTRDAARSKPSDSSYISLRELSSISVLIRHVTLAGAQGCRFMVRYINVGASDLDRVNSPSREYLRARRTLYT